MDGPRSLEWVLKKGLLVGKEHWSMGFQQVFGGHVRLCPPLFISKEKDKMGKETRNEATVEKGRDSAEPCVLEEVIIEELAVDGICGIY